MYLSVCLRLALSLTGSGSRGRGLQHGPLGPPDEPEPVVLVHGDGAVRQHALVDEAGLVLGVHRSGQRVLSTLRCTFLKKIQKFWVKLLEFVMERKVRVDRVVVKLFSDIGPRSWKRASQSRLCCAPPLAVARSTLRPKLSVGGGLRPR